MRKEHFKTLLGNPAKIIINDQLDIKLGHFTEEGIDEVLSKIKTETADHDEISVEV